MLGDTSILVAGRQRQGIRWVRSIVIIWASISGRFAAFSSLPSWRGRRWTSAAFVQQYPTREGSSLPPPCPRSLSLLVLGGKLSPMSNISRVLDKSCTLPETVRGTSRAKNTLSVRRMAPSTTTADEMQSGEEGQTGHCAQQQHQLFGKFKIDESHIFYRSPSDLSLALVNLRPIVPGHVLIIPRRVAVRLSDLTADEYDDLWKTVRIVQNMMERHLNATGFNVAVQDGTVAGQSVPHAHVHILPRVTGDFERNDDVYDELDNWVPRSDVSKPNKANLEVPDDDQRVDRTFDQMAEEASIFREKLLEEAVERDGDAGSSSSSAGKEHG